MGMWPLCHGNIASKERLEFAVLGDPVNVASRLESATRMVGCRCLASHSIVAAATLKNQINTSKFIAQLSEHGPISLLSRNIEILGKII